MSNLKKDFYAPKVIDAIRKACKTLQVSQEELDIDILETGSMGIFGLIRKKAHIQVSLVDTDALADEVIDNQPVAATGGDNKKTAKSKNKSQAKKPQAKKAKQSTSSTKQSAKQPAKQSAKQTPKQSAKQPTANKNQTATTSPDMVDVSADDLAIIKQEISDFIDLMGFDYQLTSVVKGVSVKISIASEYEKLLIGADGKVLDSMQYLLRKMLVQKLSGKVKLTLDVGTYRNDRKDELQETAANMAAQVIADGKTQAIPALSPSERRLVHVVLREHKEIRSRSVGEGHFKKVLIYKPNKNGGKKQGGQKKKKPHKKNS
jgi:spoIIIJ-associated protein